jgi:hypothetical protein
MSRSLYALVVSEAPGRVPVLVSLTDSIASATHHANRVRRQFGADAVFEVCGGRRTVIPPPSDD